MTAEETDGGVGAALTQAAQAGRRVAVAVGTFGLVHAGTVAFLREAARESNMLFVAVLPESDLPEECRKAATLMRADERRRILAAMEGVAGAELLGEPDAVARLEAWHRAAPEARWAAYGDEESEQDAAGRRMRQAGLAPRWIRVGAGACTTRELLGRIAR